MPNDRPIVRVESLYREVRSVLEQARASAYRAVNATMVQAYWHIGRLVVQHEQKGKARAQYGESVISSLAARLSLEYGRGFDERNLWYMRRFYLGFPILNAARSESPGLRLRATMRRTRSIRDAAGDESLVLRPELSWTHYRLLLGVEDRAAREWYMHEAAGQRWSTRQLARQISVFYYERLLASRRKATVRKEARDKLAAVAPAQFIRDPYVLEFLDLREYPALRESKIEQAIIDNLQTFLLELGKGFSFVARQKRMRFDDEDFYVDLVFYNYLLRCFVLIDLKVGGLTHQDIGQMDGYVRMFDAQARPKGDNPTIGLILCSKKNEAIARYSVLAEGRRIFAARYLKVLPSEEALRRELERERGLVEMREFVDRSGPPPRGKRGRRS
jgi:predicted nuclease of restriction endonuclease-like (RecB) superfamily